MALNWHNLRPWNGSQQLAFEELCCQLAAYELPSPKSGFVRKGTPDAGVECFWRLPNGDEWAWQAKFFLSPPNASQWAEMDDSVNTALEKHSRLTKYTICLPTNRPDARVKGQSSFLTKWNERVDKWKSWAVAKEMAVEFEYWGESEIALRLSREEHRGRSWFWFSEERLSSVWFDERLQEAIANAGERYTPELNVELPVSKCFDALGRTPRFCDEATRLYGDMRKTYSGLGKRQARTEYPNEFRELDETMRSLWSLCESAFVKPSSYFSSPITEPIEWNEMASLSARSLETCARLESRVQELREERNRASEPRDSSGRELTRNLDQVLHHLFEFRRALYEFDQFSQSNLATLTNMPAMLLTGTAGQGKTHLLCDIATRDTILGMPRLLLHGQHFTDDEPWGQIVRLLGLDCTRDEFLGALESAAQAHRCRVLIFIDALNEGEGRALWKKHLAGMLTAFARTAWLGIAVSVRKSYEDLVVPDGLVPQRLMRVEHYGFQESEYTAMHRFFSHYSIQPTGPVLVPEFSNPLFLKLLCRGLKDHGLTQVPTGLRGITRVMNFFFDAVNKRLAKPDCLDYDERTHYVRKAVERLTAAMAAKQTHILPREEAWEIVSSVHSGASYGRSLFRHLVTEGVLSEDRWHGDSGPMEMVRFTYERFADHLIAKHVLDKHESEEDLRRSFSNGAPLGRLFKDEHSCWRNQGLIQALSIQLPECFQREFTELAPHTVNYEPIRHAFIDSFVWRDVSAFTGGTLHYINQHVIRYVTSEREFLNALLTVAPIPEHPFNADRLHGHLMVLELVDRDAWWSVFLHQEWGDHRAVDRLVEWAWENNDKSQVPDEVIRLTGVAMTWFLTSSNRFLRDRATKALVRLFGKRIPCLRTVLPAFHAVNDPYVAERLLAVAYGCALRSTNVNDIAGLAQDIYDWIFRDGKPSAHILSRDYARGAIEVALQHGADLNINSEQIRPPYCSDWPSLEIPALEDLEKWREWNNEMPEEEWARVHLYESVMGQGDFSRYVIGELDEWSSESLGEPHKPTHQEIHDQLVSSLTQRQKRAWDLYCAVQRNVGLYRRLEAEPRMDLFKREFTEAELDAALKTAESALTKTFRKNSRKYNLFHDVIAPYVARPHAYYRERRFDGQLARRWMMKKIIDLGWTVPRFGKFDRDVNRHTWHPRAANKSERIGKKYQWIAYHELLARLSDNFKLLEHKWAGRISEYHGSWSAGFIRDIDPSNLLRKTERQTWVAHQNTWWFPVAYDNWKAPADDVAWLRNAADLPAVEPLIGVMNPEDDSRWLVMEAFYRWQEPTPLGEDKYELPRREVWYMLKSYLVRKTDAARVFAWAKKQEFMGRWMPESRESIEVFLGEYFWAPAFQDHNRPYFHRDGWTRGRDNRIPARVLVTTDGYMGETATHDCSLDEATIITLPCKFLADGMGMRWNGFEGHFFDQQGKLVALDPSVRSTGPGALLIRQEDLVGFLNTNDYQVIWTLLGEKSQVGGPMTPGTYKGRLEISGAYRLARDGIEGTKSPVFADPV